MMLRKFIVTIALCFLPLSFAVAATNPPPIIGGTLLPGVNSNISQQAGSTQGQKELNWLQTVFFKSTINKLIGWAAALAVVFVIVGGYQYLTAVGNDEQIKKAHKTITWSLIGVALAMLAFAIVQIVVNLKLSSTSSTSSTTTTTTSTANVSADLLSAAVTSSYNNEIQSIVPCFGGNCAVSEVAALPQGNFRDDFLPTIARFLIYAMGIISFIVFFASGAILVFSWGEEEATKKAKNAIVWGITGIAFAAASYLLVKGISSINYMQTTTPTSTIASTAQSVIQGVTSGSSTSTTNSTTSTATAGEGGAACGGGRGICKDYGAGWSGCWAGYSTYAAGNADCRSQRCCVLDSNSL